MRGASLEGSPAGTGREWAPGGTWSDSRSCALAGAEGPIPQRPRPRPAPGKILGGGQARRGGGRGGVGARKLLWNGPRGSVRQPLPDVVRLRDRWMESPWLALLSPARAPSGLFPVAQPPAASPPQADRGRWPGPGRGWAALTRLSSVSRSLVSGS